MMKTMQVQVSLFTSEWFCHFRLCVHVCSAEVQGSNASSEAFVEAAR